MKKIILIPALAFLLMSCGGGGGENTSSSHSTGFVPPVINTFNITWKNYDGAVLRTDQVSYGETPHYGTAPTRSEDECYTYSFKGWTPAIVAATANATYTATYEAHPKYEINSAQFIQAMTFKNRSFTMTVEADPENHLYDEILYHGENNEIFDKYLHHWDILENKGVYNYSRLRKAGDKFDRFLGDDYNDGIDYGYESTHTIDEYIDDGLAFDDGQSISFIGSFEFDDLTYDSATHKYHGVKSGYDTYFTFHGPQLRELEINVDSVIYSHKLFDYDVTVVPSDEDFDEYIVYQYPEKENLQNLAKSFNDHFDSEVEFTFNYYKNDVAFEEYHVVTKDDTVKGTHYTQMFYIGSTPYGGETDNSFVFDWVGNKTYINTTPNHYELTEILDQQYDPEDPFNGHIGYRFNIMKHLLYWNLVDQSIMLDTWIDYVKTNGKATFKRSCTIEVAPSEMVTYDIDFTFYVNKNPHDPFMFTLFTMEYEDEHGDAIKYAVDDINWVNVPSINVIID